MRELLAKAGKFYIGWQSCHFRDYQPITRCYQCQRYGHIAKHCRNQVACSHCGAAHAFKDCSNTTSKPACVNCTGGQNSHSSASNQCPEWVRRKTRRPETQPRSAAPSAGSQPPAAVVGKVPQSGSRPTVGLGIDGTGTDSHSQGRPSRRAVLLKSHDGVAGAAPHSSS